MYPTKFLKKIHRLGMIPFDELPRKFLVTGGVQSGKSRLMHRLYKKFNFMDYEQMTYAWKKEKDGTMKFNCMLEPEYGFGSLEKVDIAGFYLGDLRDLRWNFKEFPPHKTYAENWGEKEDFGIMDIKGLTVQSLQKKEKFYKLANGQLKKKANIFMIDELTDKDYFTNEMKDKVIQIMEDPNSIVIASMKNQNKSENFDFLEYIKQQKHLETFNIDNFKEGTKEIEEIIGSKVMDMPAKVEELNSKFKLDSFIKKDDKATYFKEEGWKYMKQF